jgi:hypothetical protein
MFPPSDADVGSFLNWVAMREECMSMSMLRKWRSAVTVTFSQASRGQWEYSGRESNTPHLKRQMKAANTALRGRLQAQGGREEGPEWEEMPSPELVMVGAFARFIGRRRTQVERRVEGWVAGGDDAVGEERERRLQHEKKTESLRDYAVVLTSLDIAARIGDVAGNCSLRRGAMNKSLGGFTVDGSGRASWAIENPKDARSSADYLDKDQRVMVASPTNGKFMQFETAAVLQRYIKGSDEDMAATDEDFGHPTRGVGLFVTSKPCPVIRTNVVGKTNAAGIKSVAEFVGFPAHVLKAKLGKGVSVEEVIHTQKVLRRRIAEDPAIGSRRVGSVAMEMKSGIRSMAKSSIAKIRERALMLGQDKKPHPKLFRHIAASALMARGMGDVKTRKVMRLAPKSSVLQTNYLRNISEPPFGSQTFMELRETPKRQRSLASVILRKGLPETLSAGTCVVRTIIAQWGAPRTAYRGYDGITGEEVRRLCGSIRTVLRELLFARSEEGEKGFQSAGLGPALGEWIPGAPGHTIRGPHPGVLLKEWEALIFTLPNSVMAETIVAAHPWRP